jgi:hypothetical protein
MNRIALKNFTQKSLLDKSHQERFLQELMVYSAERGDINKLRLPTVETAAKVQNYQKNTIGATTREQIANNSLDDFIKIKEKQKGSALSDSELRFAKDAYASIKAGKSHDFYSPEHQTILKKYAEQPKAIKKLFGVEPKIVTDSNGNSWYEIDIPKSFKEGKGQIKAFKNGGVKSSGEGYYDYIKGYSGIFANGGVSSKKSSWLNKYK